MQCGLLKLSRVLRERARGESRHRIPAETERPARARCDRSAPGRAGAERPASGAAGEREFAGWTVSVDNFS